MRLGASTFFTLLAITSTVAVRSAHADPEGASPSPPSVPSAPALTPRAPSDLADVELARRSEISGVQTAAGVLTATVVGFGMGQAAEGRWRDTGWIYTLGESISLGAAVIGLGEDIKHCPIGIFRGDGWCGPANASAVLGLVGFGAFHLAGIIDAAVAPGRHNQGVRDARRRLGGASAPHVVPYVAPTGHGSTVGLAMSF
jgi:hypothetical protein